MTSIGVSTRVVSSDNEFYINLAPLNDRIYGLNTTAGAKTFSPLPWVSTGAAVTVAAGWAANPSTPTGMISTVGGALLRDLGKSYLSSGRTFRKVQLVVPQYNNGTTSTFGVAGLGGSAVPNMDYLTGYIEVGFDAGSSRGATHPAEALANTGPTPVAKWGR